MRVDMTITRQEIANELIGIAGWSDPQWAEKTGVTRQTFWRLRKNGFKTVEAKTLELMALSVGKKLDWSDGRKTTAVLTEIPEGDDVMMKRVITNQLDQINSLKQETVMLKSDKHKMPPRLDHPEAFEELADGLETITKQWNWTFYHCSKPMSCSRDGKIRAINPALEKIIGWAENELRGQSIIDIVHKKDKKAVIKALAQKNRDLTIRVKKKNGNYCLMRIEAKEFGTNSFKYSIGLLTCVEKDCPDIKENDG
jgi:PAS domain S-box-containing protein